MNADNKVSPDRINQELAQTFFGTPGKVAPKKEKPVQPAKPVQATPPVKKKKTGLFIVIVLLILALAGSLAAWNFFRHKRISVAFDMDIKPSDDMRPSVSKLTHEDTGVVYITSIPRPTMKMYIQEASATKPKNIKGDILFDFEKGTEGWEIPAWAWEKKDHVARVLKQTNKISTTGSGSLEMFVEFPGKNWSGAIIEMQQYLDFSEYDKISVDVFVPSDSPPGLKGKFILTVGDKWRFVEMSKNFNLIPGRWTTIVADISDGSKDWKRTVVDKEFRSDIRKLSVRVEANRKPAYTGPIYIDSFRTIPPEKSE